MTEFVTEAVPFVSIGNRRGLTDEQIFNDRGLADFVERFEACFERDAYRHIWIFIEPEIRLTHNRA